jgi:hypothetical protein
MLEVLKAVQTHSSAVVHPAVTHKVVILHTIIRATQHQELGEQELIFTDTEDQTADQACVW